MFHPKDSSTRYHLSPCMFHAMPPPRRLLRAIPILLIILSLACSLPGLPRSTPPAQTPALIAPGETRPAAVSSPVPTEGPRPTQTPLPPALVESDPPPGSEIALARPITLYFNQPMDRTSVEGALSGLPSLSGRFDWLDDTAVTFTPDAPLLPETNVTITVSASAQSISGLTLINPLSIQYRTVGYLRLSQVLPEPGLQEVDPASAVVASFNRPVVPLGADPASLPAGLTLEPQPAGRGEWINTSTYIFYPEPALAGGVSYTARIDPDLKGIDGSPLQGGEASSPTEWSFTTALPRLVSIEPPDNIALVRLDAEIVLTFNQAMDRASLEARFALLDPAGGTIPGKLAWSEDGKTATFTPSDLLARGTLYTVRLPAETQALGGTPLGREWRTFFTTVPALSVISTQPVQGGTLPAYEGLSLSFTAHLHQTDLQSHFSISPTVPNLNVYIQEDEKMVFIPGDFAPSTNYVLTISPGLADRWGSSLGAPYELRFRTAPLPPSLTIGQATDLLFLTPEASLIPAQVVNLAEVSLTLGSLPFADFVAMLGPGGYDNRMNYHPPDARTWIQSLPFAPDRSQPVELDLTLEGDSLPPGLYHLRIDIGTGVQSFPTLLVVGRSHITFKLSATDALVWAVDLPSRAPAAGLPVAIYEENGSPLSLGMTDDQGIYKTLIPVLADPYRTRVAVIGQPGEAGFGLALSTWSSGIEGWDFGIPINYAPPGLKVYLYTDRPLYRPGQTVSFRAIARQAINGRYSLPGQASLPLKVYDELGQELAAFDLPLSAFGTAHGQLTLPSTARPGVYRIATALQEDQPQSNLNFGVADYRKPEINLNVTFSEEDALAGQPLTAQIEARYFFDAPASDVPVTWSLYAQPEPFDLPGYQAGLEDARWLQDFPLYFIPPFGRLIQEGNARTGPDGRLALELPAALELDGSRQKLTLEVNLTDESGLPVAARAHLFIHPALFYIGVRPDTWVGQAGAQLGYEVQVVDWNRQPAGAHSLRAEFLKVAWVRDESQPTDPFSGPRFVPQYTLVGQVDFSTGEDGLARLAFTPPDPGTYALRILGEGAQSEMTAWVGGPGQPIWPDLPNGRLRLTADRTGYRPGDTAQVFIPNPFGSDALALVTVERGVIMQHQVLPLAGSGTSFSLPLSGEESPNVYLSVTVLGSGRQNQPEFRHGYLNLSVEPVAQLLHVELTRLPERAGPGDEVTLSLHVTDATGQPVQGEFSLSVVDLAALALAEPNSLEIMPAWYGQQPLGVRTALDLVAAPWRVQTIPPGLGGGGGDGLAPVVRENFPDTAFWDAAVVTGANGEAQVTLNLPDTLTTWQILARGVTVDTRVGEDQTDLITTQDLLIRPVTPRFLVAGDHALLAAIVHNNTDRSLEVEVSLQASGFDLDIPAAASGDIVVSQHISLPSGGRQRVEWWGQVQDVSQVELIFSALAGDTQDAARPAQGALPVLRYLSPQTFATAGLLDHESERLELISIPRAALQAGQPVQGDLHLELSPSLAAALLEAVRSSSLDSEGPESTLETVSRLLPALALRRLIQARGEQAPDLDRALSEALPRLQAAQNPDGGWSGWPDPNLTSDPSITAYVLFGLVEARQAGAALEASRLQSAIDFLYNTLSTPQMSSQPWQIDRLALVHFALARAGRGDPGGLSELYAVRDQLSPWAQALLALGLHLTESQDDANGLARVATLLSDLQASALRSASGVAWDDRQDMISPLTVTAVVVYALAQLEPASPLLPEAARYLISHRQAGGAWASPERMNSPETAWTVLGLAGVVEGAGELAGTSTYSAVLNGVTIAHGAELNPVEATVSAQDLFTDQPNGLLIRRDPGPGRLYYRAFLDVATPVQAAAPLARGLTIDRAYFLPGEELAPVTAARSGGRLVVRLTLIIPNDVYNLRVEDAIPAGSEILDTSLETSLQGQASESPPLYDPANPFASGWGWWLFHSPLIYAEAIAWSADYLPAGTYELTYTLTLVHPGQWGVLPARAWLFYFPEVQGSSAGAIFDVLPAGE